MSESDDTDVLLLIPPDIFRVPSSASDSGSSSLVKTDCSKTGVISELVGHMQSLESRISVIESKDNSLDTSALNNSLESQVLPSASGYPYRCQQTLPRTKFSIGLSAGQRHIPIKSCQSLSVPSTPSGCMSLQNYTNSLRNDTRSACYSSTIANVTGTNTSTQAKHDAVMSDPLVVPLSFCGTSLSHAAAVSAKEESHLSPRPTDCYASTNNVSELHSSLHSARPLSSLPSVSTDQQHTRARIVREMELAEVDELLQEMEATELAKKINGVSEYQCNNELVQSTPLAQITDTMDRLEKEPQRKHSGTNRKLDFQLSDRESRLMNVSSSIIQKKSNDAFPDISQYSDSFHLSETDRMISEFKTWGQNVQQPVPKPNGFITETGNGVKNADHLSDASFAIADNAKSKELADQNVLRTNEANASNVHAYAKSSTMNTDSKSYINELFKLPGVTSSKAVHYSNAEPSLDHCKMSQHTENLCNDKERSESSKSTVHVGTNTDLYLRKCQRLLSLSDFWDTNPTRSQEETLRIKLEEEKFRREHCEHLIQELQKRLLEQQEKVAVAVRVDNDKNVLISQFHAAWSKLKEQVEVLEVEHKTSQTNLQNVTERHQSEVSDFRAQIKRLEGELSKALDLAAGYKEKSDTMTKEKIDLLKSHADELESYKSLVQEAENRYEQVKTEFNVLLQTNRQIEETLSTVQSELNKERLKEGEVRQEMNFIHKALDTCEAELTVLKQEKENLQLKLKEEINRNSILEQKNSSLLISIDNVKKAEKLAKDEIKSVAEQKEKIRAELQEVYQKQVDEVVKTKLQEFQTQLDTAESDFLEELKTRQQVIAECAAKKIKDIIDKHRLEINLLEEKHKEEKRLYELQLAQVVQKSSMLETHLNSQRATKSQLAEQLHSILQKQWQQTLHIISGGNVDNLTSIKKNHADKSFDLPKGPRKSESMPNCYAKLSQEPIRHAMQSLEMQNLMRAQSLEDQNESVITANSIENTPLTSRNNSKDDLRKYVRMIAEMQLAKEDMSKSGHSISSPPLACREVPRKHYLKKELSIMSEDSVTWQPTTEVCTYDNNEHLPTSQKMIEKADQQKNKPPWR